MLPRTLKLAWWFTVLFEETSVLHITLGVTVTSFRSVFPDVQSAKLWMLFFSDLRRFCSFEIKKKYCTAGVFGFYLPDKPLSTQMMPNKYKTVKSTIWKQLKWGICDGISSFTNRVKVNHWSTYSTPLPVWFKKDGYSDNIPLIPALTLQPGTNIQ